MTEAGGITLGLRQIITWARTYVDGETCINEVPKDRLDPEESAGLAELKRLESTMTQPTTRKFTTLKVKRLHPGAIIPAYATEGAACFDLHAVLGEYRHAVIPGDAVAFRTGLAFEIPEGHVMLVFSRSGHGFKCDIRLSNCVGVIDSDYRGEVMVKLRNDQESADSVGTVTVINAGDRIAQAMLLPIPRVELVEVGELTDTARGQGGFGSTGR